MSPFDAMRHYTQQMGRMFEEFGLGAQPFTPLDVFERDGRTIVRVEMPGLSREDVHVRVVGRMLEVEGERRHERGRGAEHPGGSVPAVLPAHPAAGERGSGRNDRAHEPRRSRDRAAPRPEFAAPRDRGPRRLFGCYRRGPEAGSRRGERVAVDPEAVAAAGPERSPGAPSAGRSRAMMRASARCGSARP